MIGRGGFVDASGGAMNAGYHNTALDTTGVAIAIPPGCSEIAVQVGAGCFFGVRGDNTLLTMNDANYGSILNGDVIRVPRQFPAGSSQSYIHIAAWASTTSVAIIFG